MPSRFPTSDVDLALVVDEAIGVHEVKAVLRDAAGELCESVACFDAYRGAGVPPGSRSLALRVRLGADGPHAQRGRADRGARRHDRRGGDASGRDASLSGAGSPRGEHGARDDEREAEEDALGERLAEDRDAEEDRDGGVEVGDHDHPRRPDLADELEHDEERARRADEGEHRDRAEHRPGHVPREVGHAVGGVGDRDDGHRAGDDADALEAAEAQRDDDRADRVADDDDAHGGDPHPVRARHVEADEQADAEQRRARAPRRARGRSAPRGGCAARRPRRASGTVATSMPVTELDRCCSAFDMRATARRSARRRRRRASASARARAAARPRATRGAAGSARRARCAGTRACPGRRRAAPRRGS